MSFLVEEIWLLVMFMHVWKVNGERGLDIRSLLHKTIINLASNSSTYFGAILGGAIGTVIEPGGGTILGSIIGGIVCGLLISFGVEKMIAIRDKQNQEKSREERAEKEAEWTMQRRALHVSMWHELILDSEGRQRMHDLVSIAAVDVNAPSCKKSVCEQSES